MMIIGASLVDIKARDTLEKDVFLVSGVRLILVPMLAMAVMRLLHVEPML